MDEAPILIVGSGMAGIAVAREFRKLGGRAPLAMLTADDGCHYSKPAISNALSAGKSPDGLVLMAPEIVAEQFRMEIHAHTTAIRILPGSHVLETDRGPLPYSKLVLAIGAKQARLPLRGDGTDDVLSINSLADYARLAGMLEGRKHVAIIGAGLIGCEFANDLASAGFHVRVFDLAPQPLCRLLPPRAGAFFRRKLEACGIEFSFGSSVCSVARKDGGYLLADSSGEEHRADLVLSATGLAPSTTLARESGLKTACGIVADRNLRTSGADIFAIGDCAEVEGLVLPYIMPIMQAARSIARTLANAHEEPGTILYPAMPITVKTPCCPAVACPPVGKNGRGAWQETINESGVRSIFTDDAGKMTGFALVGEAVREKQELVPQIPAWL